MPLGSDRNSYSPRKSTEEEDESSSSLRRRRSTGELSSPSIPLREGYLDVEVKHPVRELEGTKDTFVSYLVTAKTDIPIYQSKSPSARRRFQDFVFLHDHLVKDFPAAVVPPLPDKSRLKYVTGDRFSADFVERRRHGLERFLQRLARHPILSRSRLLRCFIESTQWNVDMHTHLAHPPTSEPTSSLLEMASDTLLNAFSKVRKPDERFLEIREGLDRFEERLGAIERIEGRSRNRITDLAGDYEELAASVQGLGFLESGITEPLSRFETALLDYSIGLRDLNTATTTPLLHKLVSLIHYSDSFRNVLKLRDQKQLDFEDLSAYLSNISNERDRIAAGYGGLGLSSYLKDKIELFRGSEADTSREAKIHRLDSKIKDLQDAVTAAHETSDGFNEEVLKEHSIFQSGKRQELKELFSDLADGNIAMYKKSIQDWENMIPFVS
ncbi:uncharacterized protein MELLADRAFT_34568 [Melampsora larici-populina 98AG31]|uniref:Sorting nexin-4 n=1 Tax=Melampsora larici-populina (strain 98AG31 / pathotype 3-4-7) TaxID=747676 RepID=F4REK1_MELLP|nr:uncharacterized protein MELLADRAFT_34568 [Melampsora larici-populina 98AG31]EGG09110.1 hypothetical protein MELLADRAFT_34568 [Melampsora larici-populina 98AG31]